MGTFGILQTAPEPEINKSAKTEPDAAEPLILRDLSEQVVEKSVQETLGISEFWRSCTASPAPDQPRLAGARVLSLKRTWSKPRESFKVLQQWEGAVLEINKDSFWARLRVLAGEGSQNEEAEFPFEEVPNADRNLIQPGAIFYWAIGYLDTSTGTRNRVSRIRFRRLPVWRLSDVERARERAEELRKSFGWNI